MSSRSSVSTHEGTTASGHTTVGRRRAERQAIAAITVFPAPVPLVSAAQPPVPIMTASLLTLDSCQEWSFIVSLVILVMVVCNEEGVGILQGDLYVRENFLGNGPKVTFALGTLDAF